jgi:hypothetical protein
MDFQYPNVEVVDEANKRILIENIDFTSKNGLDINFTSPRAGYASVVSGTGAGGTDGEAAIKGAVSHSQASASDAWVVQHNLDWLWPNVTVYDDSNQALIPQTITSVTANRVTIDFDSPVQGYAGISSGGGNAGPTGSRGAAGLGWYDGTTYISSSVAIQVDGNVSGSAVSTGSFGKLLGDGSSISGITTFAGTAGTETAFSGSSSSTGSFGSLVVSDKVQGDLTVGGTIYEQSAERFKTNIHPAGSQLEKVLKLNGVTFEKLNNYNRKEIGLIAEDVGEIYPEFVSPNSEAVNYGKMVAVLVEAIKELNEKIEKLEKGN